MPNINLLSGLLQGMSQGFILRQREKEREEERKLRETLFKSTEKLRDIQERKAEADIAKGQAEEGRKAATFRREETGRERLRAAITGRGPTEETEAGDQPIGDVPYTPERRQEMQQEALTDIGRPQDLAKILGVGGNEDAIEQYRQFVESQGGQMPGGMQMVPTFGPQGMRLRGQLPREAIGAQSRIFSDFEKEKKAA